MSDFVLLVGAVAFTDFEIPETIRGGGAQTLAIHKYPGGTRTIDAFGPDDDVLGWSGIFLDTGAEIRCRALDQMRRQGQPQLVVWSTYVYQAIISRFTWTFEKFYQIRYSLELTILQDVTSGLFSQVSATLSDLLNQGLSMVTGSASVLNSGAVTAALGSLSSLMGANPSISTGGASVQGAIQSAIGTAIAANAPINSALNSGMSSIGSSGNFSAGLAPSQLVGNLSNLNGYANALPASNDVANGLTVMDSQIGGLY